MKNRHKSIKLCLLCSHGGHFVELKNATKDLTNNIYWVTHKTIHTDKELSDKKHYFIIDPHINKWMYFINAIQSLWHLFYERPNVIISTGAGIAIPSLIIGKYLFKCKIIFIESVACTITPSKTARFMYKYSDLFIVQWESMLKIFPEAINVGIL